MGLPDMERSLVSCEVRDLPRGGGKVVSVVTRATGRPVGGTAVPLAEHRAEYRLLPGGVLWMGSRMTLADGIEDVPRIGIVMSLAAGFENVAWLGRGPHENYWDRKASAGVGLFRDTVCGLYVPYCVPQEHGLRSDARWVALDDGAQGLLVAGGALFGFGASHFSAADLYTAKHTNELVARSETILSLDHLQRGLGTMSCGPDTLECYRIPHGAYDYAFALRPFSCGIGDRELAEAGRDLQTAARVGSRLRG
jgi:beta-galactosidase